jgi:5-methylcytosine-specific restriction enzyme A
MFVDSKRAYEARRKATQPWQYWYTTRPWRKVRAAQLRAHPMCCMCKARGVDRVATVANHIVPHRGDPALFWDRANLNSLCASCHNSDQQRIEGGGQGRPYVGLDGWPSNID